MFKKEKEQDRYADMHQRGKINARIIDASSGLKVITRIYVVRIKSKDFRALIMNDYLPTLGKVEGDVVFLNDAGEHAYTGIKGFYKHQHNEFTLLINEHMREEEA